MNTILLIFISATCNSFALFALKLAGGKLKLSPSFAEMLISHWYLVAVALAFYGISFLLTIQIFSASSFTLAVPTFIGFNFIISILIASGYFKEAITPSIIFGITLILAGTVIISVSTK